ncbi:hypothetical protein V5O48_018782 [Marasmius crinis-equi]|uniref:Uncharacterized protein n=1 Tax=Marasmius crinis-equi TaxID=585013 RepID=A0ABR3EKB7_9AGAR
MHALMSVASLHLSRLYIDPTTSDQDYHSLALSHKSLGCKMLSQATDPDAHFLSLSFLGIFHFVYSTTVPDIFKLISGVHTSLNTIQGVSKGELMPLSLTYNGKFERDSFGNIVTEFGNIDYTDCGLPFLSILTHIHLPSPNYPDPDEVADPETSEAYRRAAQTLGDCWSLFQKPGCELTAALLWPTRFGQKFHQFLIVERRQRALVLLYYYCYILCWLKSRRCWWAQDLGDCLEHITPMIDKRWMACITDATAYSETFSGAPTFDAVQPYSVLQTYNGIH